MTPERPTGVPGSGLPRRRWLQGLAAALLLVRRAAGAGTPAVRLSPAEPRPGDAVLVRVPGLAPGARVEWGGHPVPLFAVEGGQAGLVGVDLDARPGPLRWRVLAPATGTLLASGMVTLRPRTFPTQPLTLPKAMVDLDAPTLARVAEERQTLTAALAGSAPSRLWRGSFRVPVEGGQPTGGFGLRRVLNGQPRSPHTGFDWAAPTGTPVVAANAGRVALVAEHFFAGRNVVLDHGLGLFTLYYHLDAVQVALDEVVTAGQPIGKVGATGRVTGPHLHFGVLLGGARVDPEVLLGLTLPAEE